MALHVPLLASRACLSAARARAASLGGASTCPPRPPSLGVGGGTCSGRAPPPCPPCRPAPQPPCRARAPAVRRALRQVCCAPPQGARPPCPQPRPACALTCTDLITKKRPVLKCQKEEIFSQNETKGCDCELDPVALRHKLAERARRADYEREVKRRAELSCRAGVAPPAPPAPPYCLGGERECARATDGCTYAVASARRDAGACCGPRRQPPPPRCVELVPDDGCRVRAHDAHLDPCAHRPRVMIEIDRSANAAGKRTALPTPPTPPPAGSVAKHAGDKSWCKNPPTPVTVPQPCRRLSIVERLRARSTSHLPNSQDKRCLHTSSVLAKAVKSASSTSGIDGVLRLKEQLKEAGVGRVVVGGGGARRKSPAGRLQLSVPPGTERVSVQVSLDGPCAAAPGSGAATPAPSSTPVAAPCRSLYVSASTETSRCNNFSKTSGTRESWLSIKNIQKKLANCRRSGKSPIVSKCLDRDTSMSKPFDPRQSPKPAKPCDCQTVPKPASPCDCKKAPKPTDPFDCKTAPKLAGPFDYKTAPKPANPFDCKIAPKTAGPFDYKTAPKLASPFDCKTASKPTGPFDSKTAPKPPSPFDCKKAPKSAGPFDCKTAPKPANPVDCKTALKPAGPFNCKTASKPAAPSDCKAASKPGNPCGDRQTPKPVGSCDGPTSKPASKCNASAPQFSSPGHCGASTTESKPANKKCMSSAALLAYITFTE